MSAGDGPRKRRQYTAEERARVLASVKESGVVAAGRVHGVPMATVSDWAAKSAGQAVMEALPAALCDESTRRHLAERAARRIHAAFSLGTRERHRLVRMLLRSLWPLT